jgi:hypothetical protein
MSDLSISYELLLRNAHNCKQYGVEGANADEHSHISTLEEEYLRARSIELNKLSTEKILELIEIAFDFGFNYMKITCYIKTAIEKVISDNTTKLTTTDREKLENAIRTMTKTPSTENLDNTITLAIKIMKELGYNYW